jgi:exopolysaccharide biosynthesis polyprenyl glycosylphosphotransferase
VTLNAFLDTREGARSDGSHGDVVPVPTAGRDATTLGGGRRTLRAAVRLVAPLAAGVSVALAIGAELLVAAGVLSVWCLVQLGNHGRAHLSPGLSSPARHVVAPFLVIALAVTGGRAPDSALAQALLISVAATGALVVTGLLLGRSGRAVRVLVVGDGPRVGEATVTWAQRPEVAVVGAALLGDGADPAVADRLVETFGLPTDVGVDDLAERVRRLDVDTVVVCPSPGIDAAEVRRLCWALEGTNARLAVRTELEGVARHRIAVSTLAECPLAEIRPSRAPVHVRGVKAAVDRVAGAILLVLVAPLLLALVVAVRLDSRGPGFFTQTRIGQGGRPFKVYKLRTMCSEAEAVKRQLKERDEGNGVLFKMRQDPRITRLGGVLRKTSLDELPQLINVVRGEMSLVGPRPALPQEVEQYDERARRRLAVRPGITGLWQVSGRSDLDWDRTVALDLHYTDNITLVDDLRICLRTVRAVASGRGAY